MKFNIGISYVYSERSDSIRFDFVAIALLPFLV